MLRSVRKGPEHLQALERIGGWTRERFRLPEEATVLVSEIACKVPGCPPIETVVAFWTSDDRRHRFKVFKPVVEVTTDDIPATWLLNALVDDGRLDCECC